MRSIIYLIVALGAFIVGLSFYAVSNINQKFIDISPQALAPLSSEIHNPSLPLTAVRASRLGCLDQGNVLHAVQLLSKGRYSDVQQVRDMFLKEAKVSLSCRENVIATIMTVMKESNPDYRRDQETYFLWRYGSEILGELKAVEALDLLISHMDFIYGGYTTSTRYPPVVDGLIQMGEIAIPKLAGVLRENPSRYMRMHAVLCISRIGGQSAKTALRGALPAESDKCAREFIEVVIKAFDNHIRPNQITNKDQEKWFMAFHFCEE